MRQLAVTYTFVVEAEDDQFPGDAVEEYVHSVDDAFASPVNVEVLSTTADMLIDKYVEPVYADLHELANLAGDDTPLGRASRQSTMLLRELCKELHRLLPDPPSSTVSP